MQGLGLGAGLGLGGAFSSQFASLGKNMSSIGELPPPVSNPIYFIINGKQSEPYYNVNDIKSLIDNNTVTENTIAWTKGLNEWVLAKEMAELRSLFGNMPPPIPEA